MQRIKLVAQLSIVEVSLSIIEAPTPYAQTIRPLARNGRSFDPQNHRSKTSSWLGNRQTDPSAFRRHVVRRPRVPLPSAAPARKSRLDLRRMGRVGSRTAGEVL